MAGFPAMGVGALAWPGRVTARFGIPDLTTAGRSEIRAVYGGFGVLMATVLLVALQRTDLRAGILLTFTCALGGMAAGRVLSALTDRQIDRRPLCYLLLEPNHPMCLAPGLISRPTGRFCTPPLAGAARAPRQTPAQSPPREHRSHQRYCWQRGQKYSRRVVTVILATGVPQSKQGSAARSNTAKRKSE